MAATHDTVKKLVDVAVEHFTKITDKPLVALSLMLNDMDKIAVKQKNQSVRTTFLRLIDEVNMRRHQ